MKILVFVDEYDYGHYTFVYNEIKRLEQSGLTVHVVCERLGKLKPADTNFTCIPIPPVRIFRTIFWWANNRKLFNIISLYPYCFRRRKIIKEFNPDFVHIHFGTTAVRLYGMLSQSLEHRPVLVSFHGYDASTMLGKEHYLTKLKPMLGQKNVYSIYVSNALLKNLISSKVPVSDANSFLLYYGIDLHMFSRTQKSHNKVWTFLQISTFVEKKGHIYTIKAFKEFISKLPGTATLVLAGDGPLRNEIIEECRRSGLENSVKFPGWISREDAFSLLNSADCFVHHSITDRAGDQEGLPNAIIEAMAMELPVISTYHSGIPELVEDGVNGYLLQEKDIESYAERMEDILDWPYLPKNREKVQQQFSLEVHTDRLIGIYRKLTGTAAK